MVCHDDGDAIILARPVSQQMQPIQQQQLPTQASDNRQRTVTQGMQHLMG